MARRQTLFLDKSDILFAGYGAKELLLRQYRGTKIGPIWIVLSQLIVLLSLTVVFHSIFKRPFADFLPYLSAGLIVWNLVSGCVVQSTSTFVSAASVIHAFPINYAIFPFQTLVNQLVLFAHGLGMHLIIMVIMGISLSLVPIAILSMILISLILYPAMSVLAVVSARFRDVGLAVSSMVTLVFLVTPIVWQRTMLDPEISWLVDFNPLVSMIDIVRQPLNGQWPDPITLALCVGMAVFSVLFGEWFFRRYSRPLPFWV